MATPFSSHRIVRRLGLVAAAAGLGAAAIAGLWRFSLRTPLDPAPYLAVDASTELTDRNGALLHPYLNAGEQWCFPRPLAEISPYLVQATVAVEDQRFYRHGGVDAFAVVRAAMQNVFGGAAVSGASTITMQTVKLAEGRGPGFTGKALQAHRAARLERTASKSAIIEAYLNNAPYGLNLVGVEAAARRYFGKPANELTLAEAAALAGLPKSPNGLMPIAHPERARARRDFVLRRMRDEGYITAEACARASAEPIGAAWHAFPAHAPHLLAKAEKRPGAIPTTLDAAIQRNVERRLKAHVASSGGEITNGAVFVVHIPTGAVIARAGSADFFNTPGGGQFDAARAPRSPGSALKPFTYAVAMQRQLLYPSEKLYDGPLDYGLYNPGNFDGTYSGLVAAHDALRLSLNVPAVALLERVGGTSLLDFLRGGGLTTLTKPAAHYGLGLTLGSCEVTLEELTALYAAVAAMGACKPLDPFAANPVPARTLLPADLCAALYAMLEHPLPGDLDPQLVAKGGKPPRAAWKTGTSTGYRDAWAFVFNRHYLVSVWLGNNDERASPYLVGISSAVPIAEAIFRSLPEVNVPAWPDPSAAGPLSPVCAVSGLPAAEACRDRRMAPIPASLFLHRVCDVHRAGPGGVLTARWPAAPIQWDLARVGEAPHPRSSRAADTALAILEPAAEAEFVLTGDPNGDVVHFTASIDPDDGLHWYLDARYLGRTAPGERMSWKLVPGRFRLTCLAPNGETASSEFVVRRSADASTGPASRSESGQS